MRQRPEHLPEFANPPLDEVVLDVQFNQLPGYSSAHAIKIGEMFESDFPNLVEHPLLPPQIDPLALVPQNSIEFSNPPVGSRFWLISEDDNHLLQIQSDRFIANWRKRKISDSYPKFEGIADSFEKNFEKFENYIHSKLDCNIDINQAEISYHNIIPTESFSQASDWFKFLRSDFLNTDSVSANFNELVSSADGEPYARFICMLHSVLKQGDTQKGFKLVLTFRGRPSAQNIKSLMDFLLIGREKIVTLFAEITTSKAHQKWERKK